MDFFKKGKKEHPEVQFVSTVPGLAENLDLVPKPSKQFLPDWWKKMPSPGDLSSLTFPHRTVKMCPSFPDYFSQGYVIPMWADVVLRYDEETGSFGWRTGAPSQDVFSWDIHDRGQFLTFVEAATYGISGSFTFKANCPWRIITPPGYSCLQLPLFYHFNKEFTVLPGIIHTDLHHEVNQQVLYHGDGKEIVIKRGTPFVQYVPFKRTTSYKMSVRDQTPEDATLFQKQAADLVGVFQGGYLARKRKFDKKNRF
jgi:hypothetical protein